MCRRASSLSGLASCSGGWQGFPGGSGVKVSVWNAGDLGLIPGSGRSPWRRKWQPTPAFSPGESHGQRSLAGYSPWGHKESDTTEQLNKNKKQSSSDQHVVLGLRAQGLQLDQ